MLSWLHWKNAQVMSKEKNIFIAIFELLYLSLFFVKKNKVSVLIKQEIS